MALDPSDLIEPPFHFGETSVFDNNVTVTCKCFKEKINTEIRVVKRGKWVNINIPNILGEAKTDVNIDDGVIEIPSVLNEECLGTKPRKRYFNCICYAFDPYTKASRACPGMIKLKTDGKIKIIPGVKTEKIDKDSTDRYYTKRFISGPVYSGNIGSLTVNISYVIDDNFEDYETIKIKQERTEQ